MKPHLEEVLYHSELGMLRREHSVVCGTHSLFKTAARVTLGSYHTKEEGPYSKDGYRNAPPSALSWIYHIAPWQRMVLSEIWQIHCWCTGQKPWFNFQVPWWVLSEGNFPWLDNSSWYNHLFVTATKQTHSTSIALERWAMHRESGGKDIWKIGHMSNGKHMVQICTCENMYHSCGEVSQSCQVKFTWRRIFLMAISIVIKQVHIVKIALRNTSVL